MRMDTDRRSERTRSDVVGDVVDDELSAIHSCLVRWKAELAALAMLALRSFGTECS